MARIYRIFKLSLIRVVKAKWDERRNWKKKIEQAKRSRKVIKEGIWKLSRAHEVNRQKIIGKIRAKNKIIRKIFET